MPALAGGVIVDANHPRSGHFRLGKCVHQPQRSAAADWRTNDVSQPGSNPARQAEADRRQGRAEPLDPPAVPPGQAGYLLGAGTLRSGRRTGGPAAGVRPFAPHSEHQRETAGKSHDPERTTLRNPGARRLRRCTAHQHALSRCSRRPTAAQRPRSTGTTTPPAGARSRSQPRTVCSADTATTRFRATSQGVAESSVVTHSARITQPEPEPFEVNEASAMELDGSGMCPGRHVKGPTPWGVGA